MHCHQLSGIQDKYFDASVSQRHFSCVVLCSMTVYSYKLKLQYVVWNMEVITMIEVMVENNFIGRTLFYLNPSGPFSEPLTPLTSVTF